MKASFTALVIASATALRSIAGVEPFKPPVMYGSPPPVKQWIFLDISGPRNHPLPILYISPYHFKTELPEFLIEVPRSKYTLIEMLTESLPARSGCAFVWPKPLPDYSLVVHWHTEGLTHSCVLPQAAACTYLSGVKNLAGNTSEVVVQPISHVEVEVGCARGEHRLAVSEIAVIRECQAKGRRGSGAVGDRIIDCDDLQSTNPGR